MLIIEKKFKAKHVYYNFRRNEGESGGEEMECITSKAEERMKREKETLE